MSERSLIKSYIGWSRFDLVSKVNNIFFFQNLNITVTEASMYRHTKQMWGSIAINICYKLGHMRYKFLIINSSPEVIMSLATFFREYS